MLKLSRKTLFAVEAVLDIAYNATDAPVQSREITARQGIPRRYLEQVLQQLVRAGILVGVRGPHGGYRLARERRRITLGGIIRAIHDNAEPDDNDGHAPTDGSAGSDLGAKVVRPTWNAVLADLMARLDEITVQDMCAEASQAGIASEAARRLDYTI